MQPFEQSQVSKYFYPSSPPHAFQGLLPTDIRDPNQNGVAVEKLQYQHQFDPQSYLRVYGYTMYSNWDINGYNSDAQPYYGWELPYFLPDHTYGFNLSYTNQTERAEPARRHRGVHVLEPAALRRLVLLVGLEHHELRRHQREVLRPLERRSDRLLRPDARHDWRPDRSADVLSCTTNPKLAACRRGVNPRWLVTETFVQRNLNQVNTAFSGYSINDQWRPDDRLNVNVGLRIEDFDYMLGDTSPNDPARQFWFNAYNAEFCFAPGVNNSKPIDRTNNGVGPCPTVNGIQTVPLGQSAYGPLVNTSGGGYTTARFQPRLGATYTLDPNSILRASFGIYARPPNSSWTQYNTINQNLPAFLGTHFYGYGFNTPDHVDPPGYLLQLRSLLGTPPQRDGLELQGEPVLPRDAGSAAELLH